MASLSHAQVDMTTRTEITAFEMVPYQESMHSWQVLCQIWLLIFIRYHHGWPSCVHVAKLKGKHQLCQCCEEPHWCYSCYLIMGSIRNKFKSPLVVVRRALCFIDILRPCLDDDVLPSHCKDDQWCSGFFTWYGFVWPEMTYDEANPGMKEPPTYQTRVVGCFC